MSVSPLVALAADLALGEPPTVLHPTVWMGRWIAAGARRRPNRAAAQSFAFGAAVVLVGAVLVATVAHCVDAWLAGRGAVTSIACGLLLKPALSVRALTRASRTAEHALAAGDIDAARTQISRDLVSRNTSALDERGLAAATIESIAENLNDALVAPLLGFMIGGLAGAYLFRFANTADSMLGYRTAELEWFGKFAARLDDLLAFVPARIAAVAIAVTASAGGGATRRAWTVTRSDARNTASPNAGWPMAAMAGALGVRLTKFDHYVLNAPAREPATRDIARARHIMVASALLCTVGAALL